MLLLEIIPASISQGRSGDVVPYDSDLYNKKNGDFERTALPWSARDVGCGA